MAANFHSPESLFLRGAYLIFAALWRPIQKKFSLSLAPSLGAQSCVSAFLWGASIFSLQGMRLKSEKQEGESTGSPKDSTAAKTLCCSVQRVLNFHAPPAQKGFLLSADYLQPVCVYTICKLGGNDASATQVLTIIFNFTTPLKGFNQH